MLVVTGGAELQLKQHIALQDTQVGSIFWVVATLIDLSNEDKPA